MVEGRARRTERETNWVRKSFSSSRKTSKELFLLRVTLFDVCVAVKCVQKANQIDDLHLPSRNVHRKLLIVTNYVRVLNSFSGLVQ